MAFKATKTAISLEAEDLIRLQGILMDDDKEEALAFLRDVVGEKIGCAQDDTHRPDFEGGIRPERAHHRRVGETHSDSGKPG